VAAATDADAGANAATVPALPAAPLFALAAGKVNCTELGELGPCACPPSNATTITRAVDPGAPYSVARVCGTSASCL
jgi:hypothetical protein